MGDMIKNNNKIIYDTVQNVVAEWNGFKKTRFI